MTAQEEPSNTEPKESPSAASNTQLMLINGKTSSSSSSDEDIDKDPTYVNAEDFDDDEPEGGTIDEQTPQPLRRSPRFGRKLDSSIKVTDSNNGMEEEEVASWERSSGPCADEVHQAGPTNPTKQES